MFSFPQGELYQYPSSLHVLTAITITDEFLGVIYPKRNFALNEITKFGEKVILPVSALTAHYLLYWRTESFFAVSLINTKQS